MRLLQFVADGKPGGGSTHVLQLLAGLQYRHELALLTQSDSYLSKRAAELGVRVFEGDFFRGRLDPRAASVLDKSVAEFRPDIVHCHGGRAAFFHSWTRGKEPSVYTVHGFHYTRKGLLSRQLGRLAERRALRFADYAIFVSNYDYELACRERLIHPNQRFAVIHNGVPKPIVQFNPPTGEIGWMGRLEYQKHPELFIQTMKLLPNHRAVMIGSGSLEQSVEQEIDKHGLRQRIRRVQALPREQCLEMLTGLDALVMTSRWEGLPLTVLEAMHLRVPNVTTSVGGIPEIITHRQTGMLTKGESAEELALLINELSVSTELRTNIIDAAERQVNAHFSEDRMLEETESVYALMSDRTGKGPGSPTMSAVEKSSFECDQDISHSSVSVPFSRPAEKCPSCSSAAEHNNEPEIAVVHDWFASYAGSERVVEQLLKMYSQADLHVLLDFLPEPHRKMLAGHVVKTSWLQRLPLIRRRFRALLPLMPLAIEQFDLADYDIVISSNHAVAKGVITKAEQLHVSYIHTPIRYAWDLQHQYLRESRLTWGLRSLIARIILHYMRIWDYSAAQRVDVFVANSRFVAQRIRKTYGRAAHVVYPPVDVDRFPLRRDKQDFYLTASRLVPYKKMDILVDAFRKLPNKKLVVIGDGPMYKQLLKSAPANVSVLGYQKHDVLVDHMQRARAFLFAAEEDFGIIPVEAQACGTPVIAFGRGGVRETVVDGVTGRFFDRQTPDSVATAIRSFEKELDKFDPVEIRRHAETFAPERFRSEFEEILKQSWIDFQSAQSDHEGQAAPRPKNWALAHS